MDENKIKELEKKAIDIRVSVLESLVEAGSGHTAGPLGMTDIFTALYFHIMKHNPKKPDWKDRDYLILSNGHICPVLYATMAHAGYFPKSELKNLRKLGSPLQGHPHREWMKGLETSSGPLGSGLSQAVGMAIADRMDNGTTSDKTFYCLMSDGEIQEGQTWEAIMLAGKEKLQNIIAIIDRNNIQIEGNVEDIMPLEPLDEKFEAFNWHTIEIDGHNFEQINNAVNEAKAITEKPVVIIAYTIPGKGVKEWEKKYEWHGKPPTKEEAERAIKELKAEM
ncbi:transketolase [Candidatus Campbellbacteria bacterium RIFCSPLOWO2_01_FULL_34_15]|uniref:Transketolase n=2 Tax=Candidatus Campbelliibacteriota TaxID=1752727 RepID=A0A1F5EQ90_9BACT|nr:MAG: transketolase [Candidatus Campbellbacteria bacterium RIFCSPHIGHO2_01_FULL_34_10]OGD69535.1 MAG: transketolase [Candidatus Campbellbacteria bacterium RIFCSPLOWO2_01_FULL_34_15]